MLHRPITHVIALPFPPSVNRIWRGARGAVRRSDEYTAWVKAADRLMLANGGMRGRQTIHGHFTALVEIKRHSINSDLDNRIKVVLDYAQRIGLVSNDKNLFELTARWSSEAVTGCKLTIIEGIGCSPAGNTLGLAVMCALPGAQPQRNPGPKDTKEG
jgi:crossover junction endodeoxyribonuclease RusA